MRNQITKYGLCFLVAITIYLLFYGIGAFCQWETNPGEWGKDIRTLMCLLSTFSCSIAFIPLLTQ